nr:hypothetical protein [Tanacetum cinerariifolium]
MNDLLDDNNFFIFDDESVKISPVSKMPFRKKPRDSMNVRSKSNSNKSLPRTVHKWLPKLKPLAEPVAKWFPRIVQICLWIINSDCSNHMTGNRALLTNFVEKFLGTVRFGNNDFAVIAGYGDVVIDGVDLLTGDCSSNLYTIALNEVASNSLTCLLAKASSSQSWLWHQRLSHLNFATINNLVENNLVQGLPKMKFEKDHLCFAYEQGKIHRLPKMKFEKDHLCSACEQGKIHRKHHKSKTAFASNKPLYLLHMDLCGPILEPGLSNLNETGKYSNQSVSQVSETSKKDLEDLFQDFYDEYFDSSKIMKSSTANVETLINEKVFHELISNNMVPNGDVASTSQNVFNARLEDAYFEASTSFHDPSNVHTYYQPYPHEKKWTKDHPLHKIIGKSVIKTKWIFKNKKDESSLVIRNKARLIAVGYSQQEGIDYDETFAPVT